MSGLTDADIAKLKVPEVETRDFSSYELVLSVDGQRYNNFRENVYRFGGGSVVVKDKRDPWDEDDEYAIRWTI